MPRTGSTPEETDAFVWGDKEMKTKMRIAWITVNFNQQDLLSSWINSIIMQEDEADHDVFIVDNSNTISGDVAGASLLRPKENLGYFGGFNYALSRMNPAEYDAVVMSNPDILFDPRFLRGIAEHSKDPKETMVIAPRITAQPSGVEQNPHIDVGIGWLRRRYYDLLFSSYPAFLACQAFRRSQKERVHSVSAVGNERPIYMAHGSCFILMRSFFEQYDLLDARVFLWGEEALLRKQVADAGGTIMFDPKIYATHHEHSSTGAITTKSKFLMMKESYKIYRGAL